ncbi:hypothetical protein C0991_011384 [Blastosporella zonata]|nr:hypothetical protein C0991_011384 [Blastosporella zonata]
MLNASFTEQVTRTTGPNGSIDWLNCGLTGSGWNPPYVTVNEIIAVSLSSAVNSGKGPFLACSKYVQYFEQYGSEYGIPPIMLASFALQESSCNPDTVGGAGEQGLMQITKDKCGGAPGGNCRDPAFNIRTGAKYFASTLDDNNGDLIAAVGNYNGWFKGMTYSLSDQVFHVFILFTLRGNWISLNLSTLDHTRKSVEMSDTTSSPASSASTLPSSVPSPELKTLSLESIDVSEKDKAEALHLKALANKEFTGHNFPAAAKLYSEAIEKNPKDATLWCNRAYTRMKLEEYGYALTDATQAIKLDPRYAKAFYRRATCYMQILKPASAVSDFKKVLALEPKNESVRAQLVSTQKLIRKIEFEKAIEMEGEKSPIERCYEIIAEGGCDVDKSYAGPKLDLEDGKYTITYDFIKSMIQWFKEGKMLPKRYVWEIVLGAHEHFSKEDSLINVNLEADVACDVIGDVHGQFYDMLHLFSLTGEPNEKHYLLMNGDLVDRGSWSIEVILTAFAFKWLYPKYMFINRGNHETKDMNRAYGFEGEAKHKHGEQSYKPPSLHGKSDAILSPAGLKRYFVVHGGIFSKDEVTLEDIRKIDRIGRQPGQEGLMCKLLRLVAYLHLTDRPLQVK